MPPRTASTKTSSQPHLALLRGINVGGKNKLVMADLVMMFTSSGCTNVRTCIQSGNILFDAPGMVIKTLAARVSAQIAARFNMQIPVVLRTADELRAVATENPLLKGNASPDVLYVAFLAEVPDPQIVAALNPRQSPGDAFIVRGREVYLHLPNGVARSKLTNAWFDAHLHTVSTVRNWRTVLKLQDMISAEQP